MQYLCYFFHNFFTVSGIGYNAKIYKTCGTTIVHTGCGPTILPNYLLAGTLSCLGYKNIYINIIKPDAISEFARECHGVPWEQALNLIREAFSRVRYSGDVKVNGYNTMERYEQHVIVERKAAKSNSFYIGDTATEKVLKYIEPFMRSITQTDRPLIAFDINGGEIYNEEIRSATSSPVTASTWSSSDDTDVIVID